MNMPDSIDSLQIEINATADKATSAIDVLAKKLDELSKSLSSIDFGKLQEFSNSVQQLGAAMQTMNNVDSSNFKNVTSNLSKLSKIDTSKLGVISDGITEISKSVGSLSGITKEVTQLTEFANGIKQLGYKSVDKAIDNIPKLSTSVNELMKELSKAPKVSRNIIDMTNALAKLARTGASSGKAAQSLSTAFDGISKSSISALGGIKKINLGLGGILKRLAPLVGAVQLFNFGKESIEIASNLTEVQNVVDTTFGNFKQKIEDLSSTSIMDLGMSEYTAKQIGSTFQAMGGAMGFAQGEMADMSVELVKLTGDMASFYDVAQEDVGKSLQSIFTGETEPLRKYGLDLTQATLEQWALNNGINASVSSMSQLEKAQLRYQYVMANTGAAQGDFAKTMDSWSNQVRILKQQLQQLASVIGGTLINALKPLVKALNSAMSHIVAFAKTISNALGKIFGWTYEEGAASGVASDFESAESSAGGIADSTGKAAKNIDKMKKGIRAFDELKTKELNDDSSSGGGSSGGGSSGGGATAAGGEWTQAESILKIFESEIESLYELGAYIGKALTDAMNSIDWESIYEKARGFGKGLAEFLNGLISPELFGATGRTIASALNTAIYAALSFGETFDWENLGLSIAEGINEFFATFDFASLAETINAWVQGIWTTIWKAFKNIKWGKLFKGLIDFIDEIDISTVFLLAIPNIKKLSATVTKLYNKYNSLIKYSKALVGAFTGNKKSIEILKDGFPKLGKAVDVVGDSFQRLMFGIHYGDWSGGINSAIKNIRDNLTGLQKGAITAISGFAEFKIVSSSFEDIVLGSENVVASIAKIGGAVGIAAAAMYTALGPAGLAIAGITGVVGAIKGIRDAIDELQLESMFETIQTTGTVSLESLGNVAINAFGSITSGVDNTIEKLNSISQTRESIGGTVESILDIKSAIDNGAYSVSEKVPQIIEQFEKLLNDSKTVLEDEYDVIVGNIVGAWSDVLTAQGQSIPEVVAGLLDLTNEGKTAYSDLEASLSSLIAQYENGEISAEEFYTQSEPLFEKISNINSDGAIDSAALSIQNLGGALDMSQYISDGAFDTTAFENYMNTVSQTAEDGKNNLETLREENQATIDAYKQQLESLGVDTSNFDWASLYGASEEQVSQGIADINSAYQDYADQVQYALLEQLPAVVQDATAGYEDLKWWQRLFTTKAEYVQGEVDKWSDNILTPATSSLETGLEQLGIEGEVWANTAATKISDSLFDSVTTYTAEGVPVVTEILKNDWQDILSNALSGAAEAVDSESYGKDTVDGYINGITEKQEESKNKIQEWMESLDTAIHDSALKFGSPSKRTKEYGKWSVEGFNDGISDNTSKTINEIRNYISVIESTFSQITSPFTQIGIDAMSGLQNGLSSMESSLYEKAKNIADNIANTIKTALDIHSPSRVMAELGEYTIEGFKVGMENLYSPTLESLNEFSYDVESAPTPNLRGIYESYKPDYASPYTTSYSDIGYSGAENQQRNAETNALLRQQNELLRAILNKPTLENKDIFNAARSVYKGEATRRYGDSAVFDPVWG